MKNISVAAKINDKGCERIIDTKIFTYGGKYILSACNGYWVSDPFNSEQELHEAFKTGIDLKQGLKFRHAILTVTIKKA